MTVHKKLTIIILTILAVIFLPLIGKYLQSGGNIPSGFFKFPALSIPEKAGFNITIFIIFAVFCLSGAILYIFPALFGFKKAEIPKTEEVKPKVSFPIWFWIGLVMFIVPLTVLWAKFSEPKIIINFAMIPLFWGFTLLIDGVVYKRARGESIVQNNPRTIIAIGVCSISGWLIFEYLNFFVSDNWYYPKGDLVGTSAFYMYAIIGSAGLAPMVFEMYSLLNTFKGLKYKYSNGPKLSMPRTVQYIILILTLVSSFAVAFYPDELFFIIWLGPLIIFAILLDILGLWSPFALIAKEGNWSPLALICLAELIMGFMCEFWNYFSASHNPLQTFNPDYWMYSIPYVNVLHVFEMPLLGLFGYIPFGAYCWVWWLVVSYVLNIPPYLGKNKSFIG